MVISNYKRTTFDQYSGQSIRVRNYVDVLNVFENERNTELRVEKYVWRFTRT